jgi:DNA repair exonuclease SbcCD ATPase subunit
VARALIFKKLWFKNFLSFGNTITTIRLDEAELTAIMGENLDAGGEDSRNGVGKSAISDAFIYAIFGDVIRDIPNAQLVNKMIRKGQSMLVGLEFEKDDHEYLIERGEKPSKLLFFKKPISDKNDIRARSENTYIYEFSRNKAETNAEIRRIMGMNMTLAEYVLVNSSESAPFSRMKEEERREVIESLLGFNILSQRAEELSDERKDIKKELVSKEATIQATKAANARIQNEIASLQAKAQQWEREHAKEIEDIRETIAALEQVDVTTEIEVITLIQEVQTQLKELQARHSITDAEIRNQQNIEVNANRLFVEKGKIVTRLTNDLDKLKTHTCPTCSQPWKPDPVVWGEMVTACDAELLEQQKYEKIRNDARAELETLTKNKRVHQDERKVLDEQMAELNEIPLTFDSLQEAGAAEANLKSLRDSLEVIIQETNPHTDAIAGLKENALQAVDEDELRELRRLVEHYNLLITLLTSNDSFLRKSIIIRWMPRLNQRIAHYLVLLQLPHRVKFNPDLTLSITDYGQEFAWNGLSKGQRQRVTIALNLAFQDVFEMMNFKTNILMVDELIDNGICQRGAENSVEILRDKVQRRGKNVLLVTHRQDIASQIPNQLMVKMKHKQSWIDDGEEAE